LNQLQQTAVNAQDELTWSSTTLVAPEPVTFDTAATFISGEVVQAFGGTQFPFGAIYNYGNVSETNVDMPIRLDFSNPSLQPPAPAPWTLTFGQVMLTPGSFYANATGTVTLASRASTDTTVNLTYVVQPQAAISTLPVNQVCPINNASFNPGNGVINNSAPPLSLTIPAGKTSATFPLSIQTFNSDAYNVQIVAWLPSAVVNGAQVVNPQSAYCVPVPNSLAHGSAIYRK
jgi:hypothetical protein